MIRRKSGPRRSAKVTENERSGVVRGVTPNGTFLLFGDCAGEGFKQLAEREDLKADVVVAPHHGGSSGGETYAKEYRWPLVLFSAGPGFIKQKKLKEYTDAGSETLTTVDTGTLTVRFGEKISVDSFRGVAAGDSTAAEEETSEEEP
jgi:beta-lactamase superfamily II metal-dependent hydrolase